MPALTKDVQGGFLRAAYFLVRDLGAYSKETRPCAACSRNPAQATHLHDRSLQHLSCVIRWTTRCLRKSLTCHAILPRFR